ncbi:MAG: AbrB family transcriptional regulator [Deltaproteobacteria bacterium CG_4_10_14_3_um_filter_60_8]|nr:MAG: AbrB family transcriptional regulator [Desulfobacterales bacterium CG2_30_60_27]PIP43401.1 MAG: AbrB family transcriptional regulator [Deltaproteobacteria bacterium CG23_combo_of_CG06-09_8_20_14_all_60_8]PIY25578.1 MAG: AbrB family transcriptional regulator [Deltaproteobacteria bacterium CG_4_10_14_3_um_filter_60_8]
MLLQTDARRRITLPPSLGIQPGDAIDLEILADGRIMLIPVEPVPKHQMWAWTTESKLAITASLADPRPSRVIETPEQAAALAKRWAGEG